MKKINSIVRGAALLALCGVMMFSAVSCGTPKKAAGNGTPAARLLPTSDKHLQAEVLKICKEANLPSIQVCYTDPVRTVSFVVTNKDFYADTAHARYLKRPFDNLTVYEAASISKVPLSYLACKMADEGKLDLDKPLWEYWPGLLDLFASDAAKERAKVITPRICMTHTTGLDNKTYRNMEFKYKTGAFNYSGPGIYILQRTLEHLWGEKLDVYSKRVLFDRLGMAHTNYSWQPYYDEYFPYGFRDSGPTYQKWNTKGKPGCNAAYSMRTTAEEFTKFLQFFMKGGDLSRKMYDEMTRGQVMVKDFGAAGKVYRGLGWVVADDAQIGHYLHHGGNNQSFRGLAVIAPETERTLVYFYNGAPLKDYNVHDAMTRLFFNTNESIIPHQGAAIHSAAPAKKK